MLAPAVVVLRLSLGNNRFNQVRGKLIALHAQVISRFCEQFGIDRSTRQNLIRTARDNGKKLGLLA